MSTKETLKTDTTELKKHLLEALFATMIGLGQLAWGVTKFVLTGLLSIWSLNTLGMALPYTLSTFTAVLLLLVIASENTGGAAKSIGFNLIGKESKK